MSGEEPSPGGPKPDKERQILTAVLALLGDKGIAGVSMRAVATEAGVSLGLVNYYYSDKMGLIAAALRHIEEQDIAIVAPEESAPPVERLRSALRRVADREYLTTEYLALRLQLWSLAQAHPEFAEINTTAQKRYRSGLATLIQAARPGVTRAEARRRAADVDVIQNGIWLTALLGLDRASVRRSVRRCEQIALDG
ncbi:TetR/AcrR family transcriptional regulator [Actinoplanes sp. NPDC051851]|uniref:TetR/AcrR family transcriptional regulator n=1 Tax=Actinoplanes sp. NPDC051851 TaxID=3154753 RepID=UPI003424309B